MDTVRITESEIMAALVDAATGDAPDDARTAQEMATAAGVSVQHVRDALKLLQTQGRLHVHRVMRMALDGRRATVAGYTITPLAKPMGRPPDRCQRHANARNGTLRSERGRCCTAPIATGGCSRTSRSVACRRWPRTSRANAGARTTRANRTSTSYVPGVRKICRVRRSTSCGIRMTRATGAAMARSKSTPKAVLPKVPPLPAQMYSAVGPIPVELVTDLRADDGEDVMGLWLMIERKIKIRANADPAGQWLTLFHEWTHAVLWHAGVKMPEKTEERVCDAMAAALAAMLLADEQ